MNSLVPNIMHTRADSDLHYPMTHMDSWKGWGAFPSIPCGCNALVHHSHVRRKGVSISACMRMDTLERREHTCSTLAVVAWWTGREHQELWPVWASCRQSSSKGCPHWGDSQPFLPPDTLAQLCPTQQLQDKSVWNTSLSSTWGKGRL